MSSLSSIQTRLSKKLGDSETVNKTDAERTQAINNSLRIVFERRNWPNLYLNKTIQGVDGIFNIPRNMDKPVILWYGENTDYFWQYNFTNQTDFFTKFPYALGITEYQGRQVIRFPDQSNKGHAENNYIGESKIGINDDASREQVGTTFVAGDYGNRFGSILKLNTVGSPTGTLTIDIKATALGLPTGSSLATSSLNVNEITENPEYHWTQFISSIALTEGVTYSITVTPSYETSAANFVEWSYSSTSQITGSQVLFDGNDWILGTGDQVFVLCDDFYKFQYTTKFIDLESPTDLTGMPDEFDEAIAQIAAGLLLKDKGQYNDAQVHFYGIAGSDQAPTSDSGYGLLNTLWTKASDVAIRGEKRLHTIYNKRGFYRRRYENYYNLNI